MGLTIEECGVVGAGGGGFPTDVKLQTPVPLVIVNGAECEPLLHKDKELLRHERRRRCCAGLQAAMELVGASEGVVGIKDKYEDVIALAAAAAARGACASAAARHLPGRRRVHPRLRRHRPGHPAGRHSPDVGAVVIERRDARERRPRPARHPEVPDGRRRGARAGTLRVPGRHVDRRGDRGGRRGHGAATSPCCRRRDDGPARAGHDEPVDKTTGGIVVLPGDHLLVAPVRGDARAPGRAHRPRRPATSAASARSSARGTCSGHPIEPHRAMQAAGLQPASKAR